MKDKIISVRVISSDCEGTIDAKHFDELDKEYQEKSMAFIAKYCIPIRTINHRHTSYGMKHCLQAELGIYMSNNQFKELMLLSGFVPHRIDERNWTFNVSEKSPIFLLKDY